ncbi:non-specific lipid transfer protein GPI-anchored 11-like isoform X2 [Salvia splendens]|uniref:non-specific lipid transfer protein GPI-anchored 11-like isoform X2 n=1 Tax=Salvia splendens TaxID=180675 RepID=UPI001C25B734|nr:non-specific lipid transfer protein GPI-anchored 11-like isoform X2 [Salvia splendens]
MSSSTIAYSLMIAVIISATATAQSPVPAPTSPEAPVPAPTLDCFPYLLNLSDCLTFVEEGSNLTQPAGGCCPELGNLVDTQPICLCQLLGDPSKVGIAVDLNRALKLPSLCNVTTPPVSLCAAIGIPVSALTPTEAPSPAFTPTEGPSSGGEETTSPSSDAGSTTNLVSIHHFLIGFVFSIYFFSF